MEILNMSKKKKDITKRKLGGLTTLDLTHELLDMIERPNRDSTRTYTKRR